MNYKLVNVALLAGQPAKVHPENGSTCRHQIKCGFSEPIVNSKNYLPIMISRVSAMNRLNVQFNMKVSSFQVDIKLELGIYNAHPSEI